MPVRNLWSCVFRYQSGMPAMPGTWIATLPWPSTPWHGSQPWNSCSPRAATSVGGSQAARPRAPDETKMERRGAWNGVDGMDLRLGMEGLFNRCGRPSATGNATTREPWSVALRFLAIAAIDCAPRNGPPTARAPPVPDATWGSSAYRDVVKVASTDGPENVPSKVSPLKVPSQCVRRDARCRRASRRRCRWPCRPRARPRT